MSEAPALPATPRERHRRILGLAVPAMGALVADPLLGAVDTAVAGRIGSVELGALGLAVSVLVAGTWIFNFLVLGTTTTVAHAVGRGDRDAAGRRAAHAAFAALALGLVAATLLAVLAPTIVRAVGAVEELVDPAVTYLRVRAIGVPFLLLGYVGHGMFRGVGDTRTPLVIVVVSNLLNGTLDVVLVFGLGLGLGGVAAATVAAEVLAVVAFGVLAGRAGLPLRGHGRPNRSQVRALVVVSRDLFLRTGGLLAGLLAVTVAAARIDADTAAAHQVMWQVFIVISFLLDGFAIAGQSLVGSALGANDRTEADATWRALLVWGAGIGVALTAVLLVGRHAVVGLFTDDPAVVATIGAAWFLLAGGQVVNAVTFALDGIAMGAADYAYLRTWTVTGAVVGGTVALVAAAAGAGLVWLWIGVELIMLVRATSLLLRLRGDRWSAGDAAAFA